ncbi:MAG TPA: exodeoxyribonuclease III [Stellaceae bacterium]|nr:exodeoxyribonuclease III [Stellaceae bacterium]
MKIATWNVNSLKVRLANVIAWVEAARPDVLALQEIKCQTAEFPYFEIEALGYKAVVLGQKSYNGVALLSSLPPEDVRIGLPGDDGDAQARYVEARYGRVRVASIYLPNGNPVDSEKYPYKLAWIERLRRHAAELLTTESPFVLAGDYNVCPTDDDVYDPVGWRNDALCRPESRRGFRALVNLGLTDAFRVFHAEPHRYSFWDYQGGAWYRDEGLRIDHLLLSPQAADRLVDCDIDRGPRGQDKASDHTPVWCILAPDAIRSN